MDLNKEFLSSITEEVEYPRPPFQLPDLSGPDGNPIVLFGLVAEELIKYGYKKEAKLLNGHGATRAMMPPTKNSVLYNTPSEKQAQVLNTFVDLTTNQQNIINEDEEFLYIKVKKNNNIDFKQPDFLKTLPHLSLETVKEVYDNDPELFSVTNIYNRNIFHYIYKPDVLKYLLEKNNTDEFVNIYEFDRFNSTILHSADHSLEQFNVVLNYLYETNPKIATIFLFGKNNFNNTPFITLQEHYKNIDLTEADFSDPKILQVIENMKLLYFIDQKIGEEFLTHLIEPKNPELKEHIQAEILSTQIKKDIAPSKTKSHKIKI